MWKYCIVCLILMQIYLSQISSSQTKLKVCSTNDSECPLYSKCSPSFPSSSLLTERETDDSKNSYNGSNNIFENYTRKCLCIENYQFNPLWQPDTSTNVDAEYCLPNIGNVAKLMSNRLDTQQHPPPPPPAPPQQQQQNQFLYFPILTSTEDLVFSVLLIVIAAIMTLMIFFSLKALQPLKRAQAAYRNLHYKRQNIVTLQEFDDSNAQRHRDVQLEQVNRV